MSEIYNPLEPYENREAEPNHWEVQSSQGLIKLNIKGVVEESGQYASIIRLLINRLAEGIPESADLAAALVLIDFWNSGGTDQDEFLKLARDCKLVELCRPQYRWMYEQWNAKDKERASWEFVEERLLTKDNLEKAISMHFGGILFGLDEAENPLVAGGGLEPIMRGMNYANSRKAVMKSGHELFPYKTSVKKSPEILKFENFTGEHLVRSKNGNTLRSSWLESGENPDHISARILYFDPVNQESHINIILANRERDDCGVRGLLRAKA